MLTLEQISTKVLNAPIGSLRWTSCGRGQAEAPNRSTMYVPIRPAKNMISVDRNNHMINLPLVSGKAGMIGELQVAVAAAVPCVAPERG